MHLMETSVARMYVRIYIYVYVLECVCVFVMQGKRL